MSNPPVKILLVEDMTLVRRAIRLLIDCMPGMRVIGEAGDAEAAFRVAVALKPDVVVTDLMMPGGGGLVLLRRLRDADRSIPTVILTRYSDQNFASEAWRLGAAGYVLKSGGEVELYRALRQAARGRRHFSVPAADAPGGDAAGGPERDLYQSLTRREREVLHLSGLGKSSRMIAQQLDISPRTIEAHRATILKKLRLKRLGELIRYAANHCVMPTEDVRVVPPLTARRKKSR
jgi:DNA-binding NarL/FixJ family response regulator